MAEAVLRFVFPNTPTPAAGVQEGTELIVITALTFAIARFDGPDGFQQWGIDVAQNPVPLEGVPADPHAAGVFAGMNRGVLALFVRALQISEDGEESQP